MTTVLNLVIFLKVIGRDTFLIGEHRVVDYECVRETLMLGAVPQLMVVEADAISIERANETVYFNLRESLLRMSRDSRDGDANGELQRQRKQSLTAALSLLSLNNSTVPSTGVDSRFCVTLHSVKLQSDTASAFGVGNSSVNMGFQLALFYGRQLLSEMLSYNVKFIPNGSTTLAINKVGKIRVGEEVA